MRRDLFASARPAHVDMSPQASSLRAIMNRHERRAYRHKMGGASPGGTMTAQDATKQNDMAQAAILAYAQPMSQPLAPVSVSGNNTAQNTVQVIIPNNVGLNTKLVVEVSFTLAATAGQQLNRTTLGLANIFSNVTLTDLNNVQRVNTTGWHLTLLAALRNRGPFGASYVTDNPNGLGANYLVQNGPQVITDAVNCRFFFEIPIAYADDNLKGAIWAAVTSAQWRLQLTINPNFTVVSTTTDPTLACYQSSGAGAGTLSAFQIQVYQEYLDQVPRSGGNPILPALSLAYNYLLTSTTVTGMTAAQDFPTFYPNYRTFLSTIAIYDQAGTLNRGSDINYLAIQVANLTYLQKWDPFRTQLQARNMIGTDFPVGTYCFDHRRKPVDTNQYGNTSFVINPSSAAAGSSLMLGYEMLAIQSQAINAGSLQGG